MVGSDLVIKGFRRTCARDMNRRLSHTIVTGTKGADGVGYLRECEINTRQESSGKERSVLRVLERLTWVEAVDVYVLAEE